MTAVAVVIPARNAAATIAITLRSVLDQSRPAAEIVVVDDGSTDATAGIVAAMASVHPRLRLVCQQRAGPSGARNRAIAETSAPLVAPVDADDVWHPDYLAACHHALERGPVDAGFAWTWHHLIDAQGRCLRGPMRFVVPHGAFGPMLLVNFVGNGSSTVFRREALDEAGGYRAPLSDWPGAEDYWLQLRIAASRPVLGVPQDLVGYRRHSGSLSTAEDAAFAARLAAVALAGEAFGPLPPRLVRWVRADARRVLAVARLRRRRHWRAVGLGLLALLDDPRATVRDGGLRLRNALVRRITRREPGERPIDPLLAARLAWLAGELAYGQPRPSGRPAPPSIRPSNCAPK